MPVRSGVCTYSPASSSKYSSSSTLLPSSLSVGHYKPLGGSSSFSSNNKFYGTSSGSSALSSSGSALGSQRAPSRYNISSAVSTYSPSLSSGSYSSLSSSTSPGSYSSSAGHYKPLSSAHNSFTGTRHGAAALDSKTSSANTRSTYTPRYASSASSTASSSSLGSAYNNYQPSSSYLSHYQPSSTSSIASRRLSYTSASSSPPAEPLPQGVPRGLVNLGNTCYMNAALQSLYAIESFRNLILRSHNYDRLLLSELSDLFKSMKNSSAAVSPVNFKYAFSRQQTKFSGFGQQDAQEFLRYLINSLHDEMNVVSRRPRPRSAPLEAPRSADEAWSQYRTIVDDSALVDILVGQLRSTIICSVCQNKSSCWDPFWDLSLPLARHGSSARRFSTSSCRLSDVVADFVAKETLDSDERPVCSQCKSPTRSTKQISVCRLPKLMILHLKKFTNDGYKMTSPEVCIDEELKFNEASASYQLAACISHHGHSSSSGHYTAHCKYSSRWFHFNDDRVRDVTSSFDSSKLTEAYVLFYTQSSSSTLNQSKL